MEKSVYSLSCGCQVELGSERIRKLCAACEAEFNETHARWAADRARQQYLANNP